MPPFPHNLTAIDELTRPDHSYLRADNTCYFLGEYTARQGYAYSATNNLILNLKKPMDRRGTPEWRWKKDAIRNSAAALRHALPDDWIAQATFVPIPPSKARGDPLHDDRMTKLLGAINPDIDLRELIIQQQSTEAAHIADFRPGPNDIQQLYAIDENLLQPPPAGIIICDDVLTTGAHYCAARNLLSQAFPGTPFCGVFIARRVPDSIDIEDFTF